MLKINVAALFTVNAVVAPLLAAGTLTAATPAFADPEIPCYVIDITCYRNGVCEVSEPKIDSDCDGTPD